MKGGYIWDKRQAGWGIEVNEKEAHETSVHSSGPRGNSKGGWGEIRRRNGTIKIKQ
jgi:hypothetical protein